MFVAAHDDAVMAQQKRGDLGFAGFEHLDAILDLHRRRTRVNDPDLGSWSYDYDSASRLIAQTDAKGQRTELSYDALSRVTTKLVRGTS